MRYFKLLYDYEHGHGAVCAMSKELYEIDRYDLEMGNYINKWNEKILFEFNPRDGERVTDYLASDIDWLIFSRKTIQILSDLKVSNIQQLPVRIRNQKNGQELEGYSVVNICTSIDAIDLDSSKYDEFEIDENRKHIAVEFYAVKGEKLNGIDIFRLKGFETPVFMSETLKNAIEMNRLSGFDFQEIKVV